MELHELKTRLQKHLSDGLVLVIGSGLSCAEGLPGMSELASHLQESVSFEPGSTDADQWNSVCELIKSVGLESALLQTASNQNIDSKISAATGAFIAGRERSAISDVFDGSKTLRLTRLLPHVINPKNGLPIITTNYDRLVEIAAEEAGYGADTMFIGRFAGRLDERESSLSFCRDVDRRGKSFTLKFQPRVRVYKPHGSLDWYIRRGKPVQYGGELQNATRLIITPGQTKFRNGYESPFDHHRSRANDAIDKASRFLIIGYGFNDDHLETHLTPAIEHGKPAVLMTYSLSTNAEALARRSRNVIAMDHQINNGAHGTRVILNTAEDFFPGIDIWDVKQFVSEVLEP